MAIQIVWITFVVFWIWWFVGKHREFKDLAEKYRPELLGSVFNWPVMAEGLLMLVVILVGVYVIFAYWNRQSKLYAKQRDVISQVTHELKSPLASIQLHLETIRLRKTSGEKLETFISTMLADTDRLHYLINNLLMAARLEQKRKSNENKSIDISSLVTEYVLQERKTLSEGATITYSIEPNIKVIIDPEEMGMVLRNLFENAVLYSPNTAEINVNVIKQDKNVILTISDKGRGIERKELKKIFDMFYRVKSSHESIRGTGLGLYIVSSVITSNGGTVTASSEGYGHGCSISIRLPVAT